MLEAAVLVLVRGDGNVGCGDTQPTMPIHRGGNLTCLWGGSQGNSAPTTRIPSTPLVPLGILLSGRPIAALSLRFPGVFRTDLLTGEGRRRAEIALRWRFLSGPPDLADLVRNSKT